MTLLMMYHVTDESLAGADCRYRKQVCIYGQWYFVN